MADIREELKTLTHPELIARIRGIDSDENYDEWDQANDEVQKRQLEAAHRPSCCEAAVKYPVVNFSVELYDDDSREAEGRWSATFNEYLVAKPRRAMAWYNTIPEPKFCTYCGLSLPKLKRKDPFPPDTCVVQDGGYYCSTCSERLNACLCLPPAFAWEPV